MTSDHSPRVGAGRFGIIAIAAVAALVTLDARLSQAPQPASQPQSQQPSEVTLVISSDGGTLPHYAVPDFVGRIR